MWMEVVCRFKGCNRCLDMKNEEIAKDIHQKLEQDWTSQEIRQTDVIFQHTLSMQFVQGYSSPPPPYPTPARDNMRHHRDKGTNLVEFDAGCNNNCKTCRIHEPGLVDELITPYVPYTSAPPISTLIALQSRMITCWC
jgi:hypothetical protein